MGKIIAIANQKGGVGKTTTVINLAAILGEKKKRVLVVDVDPQGNATSGFNMKRAKRYTLYDVFINEVDVKKALLETNLKRIDILPSNEDLSGAQVEMVNLIAREMILKKSLEPLKDKYDYIFIDTPPSLGLLTLNAFTAAESVFIPIQCEYYALEGISQLLKTVRLVKKNLNPKLYIEGVCLTMFDSRTNLSKEVMQNVVAHFKEKVYKTVISRNVKLAEAPSHGLPIHLYWPESVGALAYDRLAEEFLQHNSSDKTSP